MNNPAQTCSEYIDTLLQTYQLVKVLSDKNHCRVLQLRHREYHRNLVLRQLPAACVAYEKLCAVSSPYLAEIYDVITLSDGQIVLEEYIDGITVEDVMACGRYHYRGAKRVLTAVCHALTILHRLGTVHRDVKPSNVIIDKAGRVVLVDLNASRQLSEASKDTVIMGTVGYASPEQLGITQSDARTDIYAVGVLLNVMMTGKHPSEQIAGGRAGRIVRICTNVNPNDRYPDAQALARAL